MIDIPGIPLVSVTIDAIPPSKKNGQRIWKRGRRRIVKASAAAVTFEAHLRAVALRVRSLGANYVGVRITVDEARGRTRVDVWDLGEQPAKGRRNTRRDVHNCADAVMDALQGLAFDDDRQARWVLTEFGEVESGGVATNRSQPAAQVADGRPQRIRKRAQPVAGRTPAPGAPVVDGHRRDVEGGGQVAHRQAPLFE